MKRSGTSLVASHSRALAARLLLRYARKINKRHGCLLDGLTGFGELSSNANHTGAPA